MTCTIRRRTAIHREWVATGEGVEFIRESLVHTEAETQPRTSVGRYTKANRIAAPYTFPIVQRNIIHNKYLCIQNNGTQWREKFYLILTFSVLI